MKAKLANWKIATYALYVLEGASKTVHTEDIALKCYELAPDVCSWVNYPEYPDKEIVRIALSDAMKEKNGWRDRIETFRNLAQLTGNDQVLEFLERCEAALRDENVGS